MVPTSLSPTPPSFCLSEDDAPITPEQRAFVERHYFLPGTITLARSNEDSDPMDSQLIADILRDPEVVAKRDYRCMRYTDTLEAESMLLRPKLEEIIMKYQTEYKYSVAGWHQEMLTGWYGETDAMTPWIFMDTKEQRQALTKELARGIAEVLSAAGYPDTECVIFEVNYTTYVFNGNEEEAWKS